MRLGRRWHRAVPHGPGESSRTFCGALSLHSTRHEIGVWEHNLDQNEIAWDVQMHRLYQTGRESGPVPTAIWSNTIHPDDRERAEQEFEDAIARRGQYNSEFRIVWAGGEIRYPITGPFLRERR